MRVFVALDIPDEVRRRIAEVSARLSRACPQARWARVDGLHVTLKFIGEAPPDRVERIRVRLSSIRSPAPVEMSFRGAGFFPNERSPRVFWVGIEATPNLAELAADVDRNLELLGIPPEPRPFRPHLTLARFKSGEGLVSLRETLRGLGTLEFGSTRTRELCLYQSQLKRGGAEYTRLARFDFVGDAQ